MTSMKNAHEYIPDRNTEFTGGMPAGYCIAFVVLPVVLIAAFILFEVMK